MSRFQYSATPVSFVKLFLRMSAHFIHHHAASSASFTARCGGPAGVVEHVESLLRADHFCRVMELIDAAALRPESLAYYPSALAAAAICLFHPTAQLFIRQISPYKCV